MSDYLKEFVDAYLAAALFTSTDDDGQPLDALYDVNDIAFGTLALEKADCAAFYYAHSATFLAPVASQAAITPKARAIQAGHDFWLTRNGHGAGFWETPVWEEVTGQALTAAAKAYGEVDWVVQTSDGDPAALASIQRIVA